MIVLDGARFKQGEFSLSADLSLGAGRICAAIGPSGAGKSTLLAGIAGFLPLDLGRIELDNLDYSDVIPGQRPTSFVFQDSNLFPHLTAFQNVGLGLRPNLRLTAEDKEKVEHALATVALDGLGGRKPAELSGGQQSRIALARVLLRRKPILLLDEPFAALGPSLKAEMLDLVAELSHQEKMTVLMVTHDPEDAKRIADDLIFVANGKAAAPISIEDAFKAPSAELQAYLG